MNEQSYEEYIRSILGYPNTSNNMCNNCYENNFYEMPYNTNSQSPDTTMLENCYPEIYKIVYPMITKRCATNSMPLTREVIENMTDEIYSAVESNTEIGINITLNNEVKTTQNRTTNQLNSKKENTAGEISRDNIENRGEDRQIRNNNLRDLIKILLIRELLGRPGFPGHRPPMPPPRPRPPFPGGNRPGPGPRPPIMPRGPMEYQYPELYEM